MRRLARLFTWWLVSFAVWMAMVATVQVTEIVVGAVVALGATAVLALVLRGEAELASFRIRWLRHAWRVPWLILRDTFVLVRALPSVRRSTTQPRWVPIGGGGSPAETRARQTLATIGVSLGPNSVVVDLDNEGRMLVHQVVPNDATSLSDLLRVLP